METNQVRAIIEKWAAGVRARDIDAVLSGHSPDLLMFDVVGPVRLQGLNEYRRTWIEQFFPWHGETGRFELVDLKVSAAPCLPGGRRPNLIVGHQEHERERSAPYGRCSACRLTDRPDGGICPVHAHNRHAYHIRRTAGVRL